MQSTENKYQNFLFLNSNEIDLEMYFESGLIAALILAFLPSIKSYEKWDYFVFAQQWPASVCIDSKITGQHTCEIPVEVNTWTVHGLWPTRSGTLGPVNCNKTEKFDPDQIESLKEQLQQFWPNLYIDEKANQFWQHEWEKHGTCAQNLPALSNEYKYFSQTLKLNRKIDLLGNLSRYGIKPTNQKLYEYMDFINAVEKIYGTKPSLFCTYDKETKTQYLLQMEICIDKSFNVIECTHGKSLGLRSATPCWSTEHIAYPEITHVQRSVQVIDSTLQGSNQL